jgi:NADH-quinone oxidoreductase subunit H
MSWDLLAVTALQFGVPFLFIFVFVVAVMLPLMIYMERKVSAYMQDRRGPNRAAIAGIRAFGLVHLVADVLKLLFKEDVEPAAAERFTFRLSPLVVMSVVLVIMATLPFGDPIDFGDVGPYRVIVNMQAINIPAGIVFIFAFASLEVYGLILGGWSSANKYAFLGAIRGASQMISYELTLSLAVIGVLIVYGSTDLYVIVHQQGANPLHWGVVMSFLGFLLFLVASYAETNRTPFDLPDAEAEVVAGYHVEYSSFKFALYFMGEYVAMVVSAAVLVTLFLGGWEVPFLDRPMLERYSEEVVTALCALGAPALLLAGWAAYRAAKRPKRRFGDSRDREPAIFAALFVLGGLALAAGAAAIFAGGLEFPRWADVTVRVVMQAGSFMAKTFFFSFMFIWVRWTVPRFRYDQLMRLGWQWMMPLGLANIVLTVLWADVWNRLHTWIVGVQ